MVDFEEALRIVMRETGRLPSETVSLDDCCGRVLAGDVLSDTDMPPFNKSAMDGFACRRCDLGTSLEVIETIKAGDVPQKQIGEGECSRIMTGAMVPVGADCVVMVEHTVSDGPDHIRVNNVSSEGNIALRGEDLKKGDLLLAAGTLLKPRHTGMLASAGCVRPLVSRKPRVAILTTGDEIVEPGETPDGTKIRNSNGPQLVAQVKEAGAAPNYMGIVGDTPAQTRQAVTIALSGNDTVIITGGVSMGDYDFVPSVLKDAGATLFFEKVAVKPGRPTVFGKIGDVCIFGLPGNPVSSFTIFELFVRPHLYSLMGYDMGDNLIRLPMGSACSRRKADRVSWTPVLLDKGGNIIPAEYHGSAHLHAFARAWGLMKMPAGVFEYKKGDIVDVRPV